MIRLLSIIRVLLFCLLAAAGCKPKPSAPAPFPPKPSKPLAEFVRGALEEYFSGKSSVPEVPPKEVTEIWVVLKGIGPKELPDQVRGVRLRFGTEAAVEAAYPPSSRGMLPYLRLVIGRPTLDGCRTLHLSYGGVIMRENQKLEHWPSSGGTYVEKWINGRYSVVCEQAWIQ